MGIAGKRKRLAKRLGKKWQRKGIGAILQEIHKRGVEGEPRTQKDFHKDAKDR